MLPSRDAPPGMDERRAGEGERGHSDDLPLPEEQKGKSPVESSRRRRIPPPSTPPGSPPALRQNTSRAGTCICIARRPLARLHWIRGREARWMMLARLKRYACICICVSALQSVHSRTSLSVFHCVTARDPRRVWNQGLVPHLSQTQSNIAAAIVSDKHPIPPTDLLFRVISTLISCGAERRRLWELARCPRRRRTACEIGSLQGFLALTMHHPSDLARTPCHVVMLLQLQQRPAPSS